jgi:hypothetical protein
MTSTDRSAVPLGGSKLEVVSASGLVILASTSGSDGVLEEFYEAYDRAFVLANEKEGFDGFAECMLLNSGDAYAELAGRLGGFREFVLLARDPETTLPIGGANLIAFPLRFPDPNGPPVLSINLNYVFVNQRARRRGYFRRLVSDLPRIALDLLVATNASDLPREWATAGRNRHSPPQIVIFFEQNDPYRMSREDYELDTKHSGIDQRTRIGVWARRGARIVDFPYVQPPLTPGQGTDHSLVCGVIGLEQDALSACLFHGHLERFFAISVLKGRDPASEPVAAAQLTALAELCGRRQALPLLPPGRIRNLPPPAWDKGVATSLRDLLRAQTTVS